MRWLINDRGSLDLLIEIGLAILTLFVPPPADTDTRHQVATIVASIQRADYEGDRAALKRLHGELTPFVERFDNSKTGKGLNDHAEADADAGGSKLASRVLYWRGFAMWRRAFNGFNDSPPPQDLEADLTLALTDFHEALVRDPTFVDAKAAEASCAISIAALHRGAPRAREMALLSWKLVDEALAMAPDNPRLLWVHGMNVWYAPAERGGGQAPAFATYTRGLELARAQNAKSKPAADSLEPTWGEPELLMNLAWSNLHRTTPDVAAAERFAQEALARVPHWHYVRDILLVQIRQAAQPRVPG